MLQKGMEIMNKTEMEELALGNIERHLGDVVEEGMSADAVFDEAFILGLDALLDAGVPLSEARAVAEELAMRFAQP